MGAYLRPGRRRACRSSARSCSTRSTSSRPTGSPARTCSPPRPRPTPTAAPAGRRPRSPSSGSWTSWRSSSAATRWSCAQQNWIKHEEFPFTTVCGLTYDSGNYEAATAKAMELFDYDGLRREQEERRESGDPVQLGIGISTFTEMCGLAPVAGARARWRYGAGGWEPASIRMLPTGKVEVVTGSSAHGQGHETAWSQIVADQLGVPFEDVEVLHGDTQVSPQGHGHLRLAVAGRRRHRRGQGRGEGRRQGAARSPRTCSRRPRTTSSSPAGGSAVRGTDKGVTIQEVAFATFAAHNLPGRASSRRWTPTPPSTRTTSPSRTARTSPRWRSTPRPGGSTIRQYVCVDDIGNALNPLIVEGQVHGGLAQGIAQALFEEANYDEQGTLVNGTFVDYTLPSAADLPSFTTDRTETPATSQPAGRQGRRRGRHDRLDAGDRQRRDRRGAPPRRRPTSRCPARRSACGGPSRRPRAAPPRRRRSTPTRRVPASARSTRTTRRKKRSSDPGAVRLRQARRRSTRRCRRCSEGGEDAKILAGGQSLHPGAAAAAGGAVGADRPRRDRRSCGGIRDDGDRIAIGAMTPHHDVMRDDLVQAARRRCWPRPRRRWPTTRSGTAAPSAARSRTPTRPATSAASALALDAEMVIAGPGGHPHGAGGRVLRRLLHHRARRGRDPHRDAVPEVHRLGQPLREVQPHRAVVVDGARSRPRSGSTAARSPRPGSG